MIKLTRELFLAAYRKELLNRCDWARADAARLNRFMASVETTLSNTKMPTWICDGPAVDAAWLAVGGLGKPSIKKLAALPRETDAGAECGPRP